MRIDLYSSSNRDRQGGAQGGSITVMLDKEPTSLHIAAYGRGLSVAIVNSADGKLRAGCSRVFSTIDSDFVAFLDHNVSANDIVVMVVIGCFPWGHSVALEKLKRLGASNEIIRILSSTPFGQEPSIYWHSWVFASQNNRAIIDEIGGYCNSISRTIFVDLPFETAAKQQAAQAAAQAAAQTAAHQAQIQAALVAQQQAQQVARHAEAARVAAQTRLNQNQLSTKKETALRQQALLQAMRTASQEALDLLIELKGALDPEVQSLIADMRGLSTTLDVVENELQRLR